MRYTCTLEDSSIVIKDTIDNEEYNIKDLDINELDYIMGKGFADEVFVIQEYLNGKTEFGNRTIEYEQETITTTDKEGIVNTSLILRNSHIGVEANTIVVNNRVECYLQINKQSGTNSIKIKLRASIKDLSISGSPRVTGVVICEKDLLRIGKLTLYNNLALGIEELNKNTPTKEVLSHITYALEVRCERFSMLNLLNVPNACSYKLFTDPYNIGEWLSKLCECDLSGRRDNTIHIHDKNKKIIEWLMSLENRKPKPTDDENTLSNEIEIKLNFTWVEKFDFASVKQPKVYKDMVLHVCVFRNKRTKSWYTAYIHLHKEGIK